MTLSAQRTPQRLRQCLTEMRLRASEFSVTPSLNGDHKLVGYFDVRKAGGLDTDGVAGDDKLTLSYRRMQTSEKPTNVLDKVHIDITPTELVGQPLQGGWAGYWDVNNGEASNGDGTYRFGGSVLLGYWSVGFNPPAAGPLLVYSGQWVKVFSCGGNCASATHEVTHGVISGKEISSSSEVTAAINATLAISATEEVSASVPIEGLAIGASVSSTQSFSTEASYSSTDIASTLSTFTESREVKDTIACTPPFALWQWRATLTFKDDPTRATIADVNLFHCSEPDDQPANVHDFGWIPRDSRRPDTSVAPAVATRPAATDGMIRTADGRSLPQDNVIEYRGVWTTGPAMPADAAVRDASLVFFLKPVDGKSGYYCYNLGGVPACDDIAFAYSEPDGKRAWAVHRLSNPDELLMFVESREFGKIDGQYFPDRKDQRTPVSTVAMTLMHHPR